MSDAIQAEIKKYSQQLAADPKSRAFVPLSDAYRKLGQYEEAISVAREGINHHPHYLGGKMALARALFENGELDESEQLLEGVLHLSPDNILATRLLANVYTQKGDAPRAIPILKKLLELDPNDSRSAQQLKGLETSPPATPISKISGKPVYRPADSPVVQESKAQMAFSTTSAPAVKTETLAELYRSQGHVQQALDVYRELARKEPGNPNYLEKISEIEKEVEIEQKGGLAAQGQRVANLRALLSKIQERRRAM